MPMAAGQVKMSAGIANNAAWMVVLEAHDHIRKHPHYKHQVKNNIYNRRDQQINKSRNRVTQTSDYTAQDIVITHTRHAEQ